MATSSDHCGRGAPGSRRRIGNSTPWRNLFVRVPARSKHIFSPLALIFLGACSLMLPRDRELLHADREPIVRVRVAFRSVPPGAEAFLDGESVGRTPVSLEVEWLPATPPKRVEIDLEGYERSKSRLGPRDSEVIAELKEQIEEIALELKANPPGSLVQVDGGTPRTAGKEIKLSWSLSRREHVLKFTHPGYTSKSVKVIREANRMPLEVRLIPLFTEDR